MITVKVMVRPEIPVSQGGGFPTGFFDELLQREVAQPGLDSSWRQILIDAQITDGGDTAELTLHCEPRVAHHRADQSLRVFPGTPPAYVRIVDADDTELHAGCHAAPFEQGKRVAIGDDLYEAVGHEWPGRHPDTGVCAGDLDWQVVRVRKVDAPRMFPAAV